MKWYIGLILGLSCLALGASVSQGGWMMRIHQGATVEERALADVDSLTFYDATGSCCALDGTCTVTTQAVCLGVWTLHGVCTPNPCTQPPGACCATNGTCTMTLQATCTAPSAWTAYGVCTPNTCTQPTCYSVVFSGDFEGSFPTNEHSRTATATEEAFDLLPWPATPKDCSYAPDYQCNGWCPLCDLVLSPVPWCTGVRDNGTWSTYDYCGLAGNHYYSGTWDVVESPGPCDVPGMVWIPPGDVRLGQVGIPNSNAEPVNDFYVGGFYIDIYEASNAEYKTFIDAGGYTTEAYWNPVGWAWRVADSITLPAYWNDPAYHGGGIAGNEHFPVIGVSWWEADAYCRWVGGRLPTEAEWEKAAKGGCETHGDPGTCDASDTPTYPWGEGLTGSRANYLGSGDPYEYNGWTTPVGYYDGTDHGGTYQTINSPSPYGLHDVAGNVWEWCSTKFAGYPYDPNDGREDPPAGDSECCRVYRGASYNDGTNGYCLCSALRYSYYPTDRNFSIGFRCARSE